MAHGLETLVQLLDFGLVLGTQQTVTAEILANIRIFHSPARIPAVGNVGIFQVFNVPGRGQLIPYGRMFQGRTRGCTEARWPARWFVTDRVGDKSVACV